MGRKLTTSEIQNYRDDGVVLITNAVDEKWIERMERFARSQMEMPSQWADDHNPGAKRNRMFNDRYLWRNNRDVFDFVKNSGCAEMAAQAMESQSSRFYFDHLLNKTTSNDCIDSMASGCTLLALQGIPDKLHLASSDTSYG
jgi:hypothetical protein